MSESDDSNEKSCLAGPLAIMLTTPNWSMWASAAVDAAVMKACTVKDNNKKFATVVCRHFGEAWQSIIIVIPCCGRRDDVGEIIRSMAIISINGGNQKQGG